MDVENLPTTGVEKSSRGARALRLAPVLALLVCAGLFYARPAEPPPSDIKLAIGKPFGQARRSRHGAN